MTTISEDTPEGGPEELQWKIDRLIEQVERHAAELDRVRGLSSKMMQQRNEARAQFDDMTGRLTVATLRKAGYTVLINAPDTCDTCGEDF